MTLNANMLLNRVSLSANILTVTVILTTRSIGFSLSYFVNASKSVNVVYLLRLVPSSVAGSYEAMKTCSAKLRQPDAFTIMLFHLCFRV